MTGESSFCTNIHLLHPHVSCGFIPRPIIFGFCSVAFLTRVAPWAAASQHICGMMAGGKTVMRNFILIILFTVVAGNVHAGTVLDFWHSYVPPPPSQTH